MNKLKQVTSKVVDSLLKNPHKKNYEKEYITLLEQIVELRDKRNFFDDWMVDFFIEDIIDTAEPLLNDYKTLSVDGKKCAKYMLHHYIYWYYNTDQEDAGDVLKYKTELKAKIKYESSYVENLLSPKQKEESKSNNEEVGKVFEMAICKVFNTPFNGEYIYSEKDAEDMSKKLSVLKTIFSSCEHIGKQNKYDFKTNLGYLSAKTTKISSMACPQVIGQCAKDTFAKYFNLPLTSTREDCIKYVYENTSYALQEYIKNTFHCSVVYYDTKKNKLSYIIKKGDIVFEKDDLSFSRSFDEWKGSCQIRYKNITIGNLQTHSDPTRKNIVKFRWNFNNVFSLFKNEFDVKLTSI
jgi:hypothetical protein